MVGRGHGQEQSARHYLLGERRRGTQAKRLRCASKGHDVSQKRNPRRTGTQHTHATPLGAQRGQGGNNAAASDTPQKVGTAQRSRSRE